jgi:hypothetical protein
VLTAMDRHSLKSCYCCFSIGARGWSRKPDMTGLELDQFAEPRSA